MKKLDNQNKADIAAFGVGMAAGAGVAAGATKLATDALMNDDLDLTPIIDEDEVVETEEVISEPVSTETPEASDASDSSEVSSAEATAAKHTAAPSHSHHSSTAEDHTDTTEEVEQEEVVEIITEENNDDILIDGTVPQDDDEELEIQILGHETVTLEDGTDSDFVFFAQEGRQGAIVDIDQDGRADFMMFDANSNGDIEDAEVFDIRQEGVDMAMFITDEPSEEDLIPTDADDEDLHFTMDDEGGDYINDADVDDFFEA